MEPYCEVLEEAVCTLSCVTDGKELNMFRGWLTSVDFALFLDIPGVKRGSFGRLHRRAFIEVLRQVRLIEPRHVHHLALRNIVLLHVSFNSARHAPRVPAAKHSSQRYHQLSQVCLYLCVCVMCSCKTMPLCFEKSGIINDRLNMQTFKI